MKENKDKVIWDGEISRDVSRKRKKEKRRYVIEHRYGKRLFPCRNTWRVYQKYLTEKSAREAMKIFMKNSGHCFSGRRAEIKEYKAKSCPEELLRFGIYINGELDSEYRLLQLAD